FLEAKWDNNQELQTQITTLIGERDNIQQNLTNLENKLKRIQKNFLGSLFRSGKKSQQIKDLRIEMIKLRAKLIEKDQQIEDLINERDNLAQEKGELEREKEQLTTQKVNLQTELTNLINNIQNHLGISNLNNLPTLPEGETLAKQERANDLQRKLEIEQGWWDKWIADDYASREYNYSVHSSFGRHFLNKAKNVGSIRVEAYVRKYNKDRV
ncbi:15965_t:CDS:2, partial [Cetraspora pellucida]